ncbi:hypothetical protein DPMN_011239 [Dreissena polymorpha]|uniref:Uncharacterized protein n=1 Tax=Dreissena polymorpha TaxID=45954 RepID=A0A9D4N071_DREPO|nr:hypothetical protein DPMN_011239 [Dreissena polymorpha]
MKISLRNTAPPPGGHVFQWTHDPVLNSVEIKQKMKNVDDARQATDKRHSQKQKIVSIAGSHAFEQTTIIFKLIQDMFHKDWAINEVSTFPNCAINVTSRVFTILNSAGTFIGTNLLIKFQKHWAINMTNVMLTSLYNNMFLPTFMTSEHPGSHIFQQTRTIFIHIQDII